MFLLEGCPSRPLSEVQGWVAYCGLLPGLLFSGIGFGWKRFVLMLEYFLGGRYKVNKIYGSKGNFFG